jgi:polyisoprenoid-binding protein YceI
MLAPMKKLLGLILVVLVLAGGAFYWFVIRDDAPPKFSLSNPSSTTVGTSDGSTSSSTSVGPLVVDGKWTVRSGEPTAAGFRINESFASGLADHTAVGRTNVVSGSITVAGTKVTEAAFTVDMTRIGFTDDVPGLNVANRTGAIHDQGLETARFPEATFVLTKPIDLGSVPKVGKQITAQATGDLTLHGVKRSVTFSVDAQLVGGRLEIVSTEPVPVNLADYEMTAPEAPFVASVSDKGSFEFHLFLDK